MPRARSTGTSRRRTTSTSASPPTGWPTPTPRSPPSTPTGPFETVFREALAICWRRATADRVHARILRHVQRPDYLAAVAPETRAALDAADARVGELLAGLVELGVDEGALPAGRPSRGSSRCRALLAGALASAAWPGIEDPSRHPRRRGPRDPQAASLTSSSMVSPPLTSQTPGEASRFRIVTTPSSAQSE